MTSRAQPPDHDARRLALTTPNHAFVWASAGTGKTHTLTLRALYLLLNASFLRPDLHPENVYHLGNRSSLLLETRRILRSLVLATFTRKAAAEMQQRLFGLLDDLSTSPPAAWEVSSGPIAPVSPLFAEVVRMTLERIQSSGVSFREAFSRLQRTASVMAELASELRISTLHSFCAELLRRYPIEAGIPPEVRFAREEDSELEAVPDLIVGLWWRREVERRADLNRDLEIVLQSLSTSELNTWLRSTLDNSWLCKRLDDFESDSPSEVDRSLQAIRTLLERAGLRASGEVAQECREGLRLLDNVEKGHSGSWTQLVQFLNCYEKRLFSRNSSLASIKKAFNELPDLVDQRLDSFDELYFPLMIRSLNREHRPTWEAFRRVLDSFSVWSKRARLEELKLVTFDDMIRLSLQLLNENPAVRWNERRRLMAFLVDEFQDTDPDQLAILRALLSRESDEDHEVLGFFVGDRKQSIYRFRNADLPQIEAFSRSYEEFVRCPCRVDEFQLTTTFRCLSGVTDFVNHFFDEVVALAPKEEQLIPVDDRPSETPEWVILRQDEEGRDLNANAARIAAAEETVRLIQQYLQLHHGETGRYSDILVLVAQNNELDTLIPRLQDAGIPTVSSGARSFYRHPEVLDVLNLLIALWHPHDSLATATVLRSPLVMLSDEMLAELLLPTGKSDTGTWSAPDLFHSDRGMPDFLPKPARIQIERMRALAANRHSLPLVRWLQEISDLIPMAVYSHPNDREGRALVRIQALLRSFREAVHSGVDPPFTWLLKQRARAAAGDRWDSDLGEDVNIADESVNAVRVLTVHKAKGLEGKFVVVNGWAAILARMKESKRGRNNNILSLFSKEGSTLNEFSFPWGPFMIRTPGYSRALLQDRQLYAEEGGRLAYVALTRSRERLKMICAIGKRTSFSQEVRQFLATWQRSGQSALEPELSSIPACGGRLLVSSRAAPKSKGAPAQPPLLVLSKSYNALWAARYSQLSKPGLPTIRRPSEQKHPIEEEASEKVLRPMISGRADSALAVGRIVHTYLERHLSESQFSHTLLKEVALGLEPGSSHSDVLASASEILRRFWNGETKDTSGRPLRERVERGRILGREVPFYLTTAGEMWNGVIDLILEEPNQLVVVDFKTGKRPVTVSPAHQQQETIYSEVLARLFPNRPTSLEFWWLGS